MRQSGIIAATALAASVSAALTGPPPGTNTFTVDCNRQQTIAGAIVRDDVTLQGDPHVGGTVYGPDPNANTLQILASRVTIDNLTVTGGRVGVQIQDSYGALIQNTVVEHTALDGIRIFVGDADVTGCTVQESGGTGIFVHRGGVLRLLNSQVHDNHRATSTPGSTSLSIQPCCCSRPRPMPRATLAWHATARPRRDSRSTASWREHGQSSSCVRPGLSVPSPSRCLPNPSVCLVFLLCPRASSHAISVDASIIHWSRCHISRQSVSVWRHAAETWTITG